MESADFLGGSTGRGSKSGDEQVLQGAETGVPAGVWNSALSYHGSSLVRGGVKGNPFGAEGRRSRREGGIGVWMGARGCTSISKGLVVLWAGVLRADW